MLEDGEKNGKRECLSNVIMAMDERTHIVAMLSLETGRD